MFKHCPGANRLIEPAKIIFRSCPACGNEVEFFSDETEAKCSRCGHTLYLEATPSCVSWCQYADKCVTDLKDRGLIPPSRAEELGRITKKSSGLEKKSEK